MNLIRGVFSRITIRDFKLYLFFSILLIVTLLSIKSFGFTQSRYESEVEASFSPNLAFFLVDVMNTSGQIKLDGMIPSATPYLYTFEVSNFDSTKHAQVDLTYSIEIVTTTNMPLQFRIYKGNNSSQNEVDSDTVTTDSNGVYYRHLVINDVSVMNYNQNVTDTYTLWVLFPATNASNPDAYAGVIDLVDIKINAEQVV